MQDISDQKQGNRIWPKTILNEKHGHLILFDQAKKVPKIGKLAGHISSKTGKLQKAGNLTEHIRSITGKIYLVRPNGILH